jgi:DNA repair protein RecO (recombination protein O)
MTWGIFDLYRSPRALYIKGVDIREDFLALRGSRHSLLRAVKWCRDLSSRLPSFHENDSVLSLLWSCMKLLAGGASPPLLDARFAWRWGNIWGVAPSLERCSSCLSPIGGDSGPASLTRDGFVCRACAAGAEPPRGSGRNIELEPRDVEIFRACAMSSSENFAAAEPEMRRALSESRGLCDKISSAALGLYSFLDIR